VTSRFTRAAPAGTSFADGLLFDVDGGPTAPAAARAVVADWLAERVERELIETTLLLLSELVSNAVEHGRAAPGTAIETLARASREAIHVEVSHPGSGFSRQQLRPAGPDDIRGRGLRIVERFAESWDVVCADGRCYVWFELRRPTE
jgi:anti-sigma regulatory factor (Ser/Thr protein kinase)